MKNKVGAVLWMCCVQFFVAEQMARSAWSLPYSFRTNFISDLGSTFCDRLVCSPWHALMNGSFALQGVLIAAGAILVWKRKGWLGAVSLMMLIACGLGTLVVGLIPENGNAELHKAGAAVHFLAGGASMIAVGATLRSAFGWSSTALGSLVLCATLSLGQRESTVVNLLGVGFVERVAAYGIAGWMTALGFRELNQKVISP